MSLDITTLLTPMTSAQIRASMVTALVGLGIPADKWNSGGVASSILTVVSSQFATFQNLMVQAVASGFLSTATGGWLTLLAQNTFNVTRIRATFASGQLTLTNTGGGIYTFVAGAATFANPNNNKNFTNTAGFTLGAFATLTINIQAVEAGTASNSPPNTITTLVTVMLGVTCTNALAVTGTDQESDAALRQRCIDKLGMLSPGGVRQAYDFAVKSALNGGVPVNINRTQVGVSTGTGVVTIFCASPSGTPSGSDLTAANTNVQNTARPDAVTAVVLPATVVDYVPTITVYVRNVPGVADPTVIQTEIETALDNFFAVYPIGGLTAGAFTGVFGADIAGQIVAVDPGIFNVVGATDLALTPGQVAANGTTIIVVLS